MKKILFSISFTLSLCMLPSAMIASPQLPDYIIFRNDTIPTYNLILESYLQKKFPEENTLFGLAFRDSNAMFMLDSNSWRGYQAIYEIKNDSLFLADIITPHSLNNFDKKESNNRLISIFGDKVNNGRVFLDWFTGDISFRRGTENEIIRWDGIFEIIFRYETAITLKKGKVKDIRDVENYIDSPKRINRIKTDSLHNIFFEYVKRFKWRKTDKFDCSDEYYIRINKKGRIDKVEMNYQENEIEMYFEKNEYRYCTKCLKRALKKLKFDIIKRKGKPIEEDIYLELWFKEDGSIENWTN